jgi:hypothetical protein
MCVAIMIGTRHGKHGDQVMWWWSAYHDLELEQGATSDVQGKGIM